MKKLTILFIIGFFVQLGASPLFSQSLDGYTLHSTDDGVSLYYKVTDFAISFKVKNTREKSGQVHTTMLIISVK